MSDVTEYVVVNICRSDGQDNGPGYWPAPVDTAAKALKKPAPEKMTRAKPQMVRLADDDPRFQEWRVKLGILLKQELSPTEGLPWLVNFPRGFWLYEKSKHLWVSGYPVKAKLFKSPQEFGLHLLWLLSNSVDRMDCRCIHCNIREVPSIEDLTVTEMPRPVTGLANAQPPSKIRKITPQMPSSRTASPVPAPAAPPPNTKKETPVPIPAPVPKQETPVPVPTIPARLAPVPTPAPTKALAQPPVQPPAQNTTVQPSPNPRAAGQSQAPAAVQPQTQKPVPHPQQSVAQTPYQQSHFLPYPTPFGGIQPSPLFRVGELVWFQMSSGWRLGIVAATGIINPKTTKPETLQILPISHALFNQTTVQQLESSTRPFLAFSVPNVNIPELQNKIYDNIPWDTFLRSLPADDTHRREVTLLDSSKMAAQKINGSFSVFTRISETEGGKKIDYQGVFLGAERVEVGDALRIRITAEQGLQPAATNLSDALLGLREICTAVDVPGSVFFKGDIYQPISGDTAPIGGIPVPEDKLPRPLAAESAFRNRWAPGDRWRCVLLKHNAVLREQDLKGRFYPTHKLLPLLDGQKVSVEVQQGIVRDAQQRLNQRIDTLRTGYIGRKRTRVETIGPALPPNSVIHFESSVREEDA